MTRRHDWTPLRQPGDFVMVPGADARSVSALAKAHVERVLGTEVLLATRSTPAGAYVALAYVHSAAVEPAPATPPTPVYSEPEPVYAEDEPDYDPDEHVSVGGEGYSLEDDT